MSTARASSRYNRHAQTDLFGHPRGLSYLFATEMWERFSYYGMRALLVLYMVKYLLEPERARQVMGLSTFKTALESIFGALAAQPFASHIYGFYSGLVYLTPILGGLLADRVLGRRRTVILGAALMAVGHFAMAFEQLFLFALGLLILGKELGWHYGFTAAGFGMTAGLVIYLLATPHLPKDTFGHRKSPAASIDKDGWRSIFALLLLFLPVSLFWATYEQQGNTIALWADQFTDRRFFGAEIPVTWFQAFNPFMIFAFTPFVVAFWRHQGPSEPSTTMKLAIGCFLTALAYLVMALAAWNAGAGKASWVWLLAYFIVITIGELYLSPTSLSLVTKIAPASLLSMMMGVWLATSFVGNFLAGYLGSFWSSMGKIEFFLMLAIISGTDSAAIVLLSYPLRSVLRD